MTIKTGRVSIALDGNTLMSKKGAILQIGDPKVTVEMSDQGDVVETEALRPSRVKCTLLHVTETDLPSLRRFRGTVTYKTDNGHNYVISPAAKTELGDLQNGEVDIEFMGAEAELA